MVAPIDAKASFEAEGETFELAMNFRTIALAEDAKADVVTSFGSGKPTVSGMSILIWAFAQPAHPDLTTEDAFALAIRHGEAVGGALGKVFAAASAKADGSENPPKAKRAKGSTA